MVKRDLDKYDVEILSALIENSRTSFRELSRKLRISVSTVHSRIQRLISMGVIKGFTTLVNHRMIGYDVTALILMRVDGKHIVDVERELATESNVCAVYDITGDYDVAVIAKFRNVNELNKFIKKILKNPNIERTNTSIVFNIVKEDFRLEIPRE